MLQRGHDGDMHVSEWNLCAPTSPVELRERAEGPKVPMHDEHVSHSSRQGNLGSFTQTGVQWHQISFGM